MELAPALKKAMRQMSMEGLATIDIDFEDDAYSSYARELNPSVYRDGDSYCCLLGPDPIVGIFGYGDTPQAAVADWTDQLKERVKAHVEDDEIAQYVIDSLDAMGWVVW